jgi:L-ribulose-5-phosphate 3-epimerase
MRSVSFITANFVGRVSKYPGGWVGEWMNFDAATLEVPPASQFDAVAAEIAGAGFNQIDLWTAHAHSQRHGREGADAIKHACATHNLTITSYVGGFQATTSRELDDVFKFMKQLGAPIFAGNIWGLANDEQARLVNEAGERHNITWAFENHAEKKAGEMLARISNGEYPRCKICLDTGWCGTQGLDALEALKAVRPHLHILHLKDVVAAGGHETCALGDGIVPVERCVRYLIETNWHGVIGVEHEPFDRDPMPEVQTSLQRLRAWLI